MTPPPITSVGYLVVNTSATLTDSPTSCSCEARRSQFNPTSNGRLKPFSVVVKTRQPENQIERAK